MNPLEIEQMRMTALKLRQQGRITVCRPLSEAEVDRLVTRNTAASTRQRKAVARLETGGR